MKKGFSLLLAIIVVAAVLIYATSQFDRVKNFVRFGNNKVLYAQAQNLAEAGVDYALWQLNKNAGNWYSSGSEVAVGSNGAFFVTVVDTSPNVKTIQSTGYIPNSTNPRAKAAATTQAVISGQTVAFNFAAQVGTGGVIMNQSSQVNGNIYSNGNISAGAGNSQTIDGEAYAVGTIDSPPITITTNIIRQNQPPSNMPTVNYQLWKDEAAGGGTTTCSPTCEISGITTSIGPQKYVGNLLISNQAEVTINGPIYVSGNITVRNGGTEVNLNENFGSNGTVIIADGTVTVEQGGSFNPTLANPPGYILVVTTSTLGSAMSIGNSGANAVFYALDGGATLSQTAQVNALVAKTLTMQNSATLTYATGLASAEFNSGPGGSWQIKKGTFKYTN